MQSDNELYLSLVKVTNGTVRAHVQQNAFRPVTLRKRRTFLSKVIEPIKQLTQNKVVNGIQQVRKGNMILYFDTLTLSLLTVSYFCVYGCP